jgi:predicted dehydrogenase
MIGSSQGNGHPYSFSAIVNGFNPKGMADSGWEVIYNYLRERDASEFGFDGVSVTHVWTQDRNESKKIARASKIQYVADTVEELADQVDAVIIARDDYSTHYQLSKIFLNKNKFVFIDKPLSLNLSELQYFQKYLQEGKLMSCSAMRYAKELDNIRANLGAFGKPKLIRGTSVKGMPKYGIHLLDGIFSVIKFNVASVHSIIGRHSFVLLKSFDNTIIEIDTLGVAPKTFLFDFWSDKQRFHAEICDNFSMFRRLLFHFLKMMRSGKPEIPPDHTLNLMKVLIAAKRSIRENREVNLSELPM